MQCYSLRVKHGLTSGMIAFTVFVCMCVAVRAETWLRHHYLCGLNKFGYDYLGFVESLQGSPARAKICENLWPRARKQIIINFWLLGRLAAER